ncbi:MAG: hypothetical protein AAGA10_02875 [Bacteroidota bacterium]
MESKYKTIFEKQKSNKDAIEILVEKELYTPAVQILWTITRNSIFSFLERRKIDFHSTQEAITIFILGQDSPKKMKCIYEAYTSSIISEWDEDALISKKQFKIFEKSCLLIQSMMIND